MIQTKTIMKVTIRNRKTGEFFAGGERWVTSALLAHDFHYSDEAEECCEKLGLAGTAIFYIFNQAAAV